MQKRPQRDELLLVLILFPVEVTVKVVSLERFGRMLDEYEKEEAEKRKKIEEELKPKKRGRPKKRDRPKKKKPEIPNFANHNLTFA